MDRVLQFLPSAEKGYLPYYLLIVSSCQLGPQAVNVQFTAG